MTANLEMGCRVVILTSMIPTPASHMFQIYEDDLAELERLLPQLCDALFPTMNGRTKVHLRRCKTILSNVRWNYGPPDEVHIIPADGEPPSELPGDQDVIS